MIHTCTYRVYYEDTDAGGVVYYANYLKFAERARTECLRDRGIDQSALARDEGIIFVVRHATLDIKKPARLDDEICISTTITEVKGASIHIEQTIETNGELLVFVHVTIACVSTKFKPTRLPALVKERLES